MAIMIILKNRKRKESVDKARQQCSFPVVKCIFCDGLRGQGAKGRTGRRRKGEDFLLNMNFSVGVNMYSEKVTCNR
jgi:hypothetical protein